MSIIREEGVCFFTHDEAKAVSERGIPNSVEAIVGRIHKKRLSFGRLSSFASFFVFTLLLSPRIPGSGKQRNSWNAHMDASRKHRL